jgi:DNA-binding NarL/FixJ family response regulator
MTDLLRVVIADDHPVFRSGLGALLSIEEGVEVVGEAATGLEAVRLVAETQPDVVVMDLHMPELDGVAATRQIVHDSPHVAVLVLTMFDDDDSVFAAMRAGARGYVLKGTNQAEVTRAVHLVGAGGAMFGPAVAERVIEFFSRPRPTSVPLAFPQLSDREREFLDLVAQGHLQHLHEARGRGPRSRRSARPTGGPWGRVAHPRLTGTASGKSPARPGQ